ncbi:MAG: HAMP domain-containing protein [Spirochaetales bacterium]|nr:HAMP domain-containing protein [Spirochaetales bacterium]MCF7939322.1 HAMP domain-containing protein [Spirochaetales bacterium]
MKELLTSRLGRKIFVSHLIIIGVGVIVLMLTVRLQAPYALNQHIREMEHLIGENEFLRQNLMNSFQSALTEVILIAASGALLAALIVSSFVAWRIVSPIRSMIRTVVQIADGDYRQRAHFVWDDELGELAKNFNRMAEELHSTETRRIELIGNVAHELRTPLASIRSLTEGMIDGVLPADFSTYSAVQTELTRLQRLVGDLENLSQAESGQIKLNLQEFNLNDLVEQVALRLKPQFSEKQIDLETELSEPVLRVQADWERMQQVIINLLGNALQYTPSKGKVRIYTESKDEMIVCGVEDNGIGLSDSDIGRIFERFYRVDKSRSRAGGGSGIGLTIAHHIIKAHGGSLRVESPGLQRGSRFYFTLPPNS